MCQLLLLPAMLPRALIGVQVATLRKLCHGIRQAMQVVHIVIVNRDRRLVSLQHVCYLVHPMTAIHAAKGESSLSCRSLAMSDVLHHAIALLPTKQRWGFAYVRLALLPEHLGDCQLRHPL